MTNHLMTPPRAKQKTDLPDVENLSYEQALAELETIVSALESSTLPLDETMALFERGKQLTRHCVELLDKAELRIKQLSGDNLVDLPAAEE